MKFLGLICIGLLTLLGRASTVLWDCYTLDMYGELGTMVPTFVGKAIDCSMFPLTVQADLDNVHLTARLASTMETCCAWGLANWGDLLDETYFQRQSSWFYKNGIGQDIRTVSDYEIVFEHEEDVYLAVVAAWYEVPGELFFGWVHLVADDESGVRLLDSAFDLDGNSIRVGIGPIPEPSCALLALLGGALLVLRRRRWDFGEKRKTTMP